MKIRKFKVSSVLYFKSGNSKKVDWIEEHLVKRVKLEDKMVTESLTLEEAEAFFQGKFKDWKNNGDIIVRKNVKGDSSVIPFSEIEYATVSVEVVDDESTEDEPRQPEKRDTVSPIVPEPPKTPPVRSIEDHPAFKK